MAPDLALPLVEAHGGLLVVRDDLYPGVLGGLTAPAEESARAA